MPTRPEPQGVPGGGASDVADALLRVRDLKTHFSLRGTFAERILGREAGQVKAVDGVSFDLRRGEVLGLVGESGSGKTTLGRTILRLVEPTSGSIMFEGRELVGLSEHAFRPLRQRMQMVFQDPHASLNPAMDLLHAVGHPAVVHGLVKNAESARDLVADALRKVGLAPVDQYLNKYPSDLSGGQKQRAVLARAILLGPDLLVADEPVSMLDMSVRAKILELMLELRRELDLTYLYITHDLATAKFFCDRVAIMYLGKIVEFGPTDEIFAEPKHPYTVSLLKAIPDPDPDRMIPRDLPRGEVPDAVNPPLGCSFHPRCPQAFEVCGWESRDVKAAFEARWTAMSEEDFERERAVVGSLEKLEVPSPVAHLVAGKGSTGEDVLSILKKMQQETPGDPLWRGVRSMTADHDHLRVELRDALDPELLPIGDVEVACHLFDERAMGRARHEEHRS